LQHASQLIPVPPKPRSVSRLLCRQYKHVSPVGLVLASLCVALGDAFRSGADQALLFESCVAEGQTQRFQQIDAKTIAHAVDISSRRQAEEEAREANRLKDEFLATLSHELRTPLNVVAGWVRLLGRTMNTQPNDVRRGLPVLERNVDVLRRLTDDLLGMSDVLAGRISMERRPVLIDVLLSEIAESLAITAQAKQIVITSQLGSRAVVEGDENRLRQVFWNVVSNALKFTPEGGAVSLSTRFDGTHAIVEIVDTRVGIAPSFLPHVFDKFRQEDGTHTREHSGLGLGLAIARQFVELHDGTISAASAGRGRGSSFLVLIPASRPAAVPAPREPAAVRVTHERA
jgi:signal transduction histidine kinase